MKVQSPWIVWPAFAVTLTLVLAAGAAMYAESAVALSTPTPSTGRGPFFPVDAQAPADNDLRTVAGGSGTARGVPLRIEGRIIDPAGTPVEGVEITLWQVDAGGSYNHPDEPKSRIKTPGDGKVDTNFQYWGKSTSDDHGAFRFETVVPGHYRAMGVTRPNHVHFEFRHPEFRTLATEMNFRGDPNLENDFVTSGLDADQLSALQVDLEPLDPKGNGDAKVARWTVVLRRIN